MEVAEAMTMRSSLGRHGHPEGFPPVFTVKVNYGSGLVNNLRLQQSATVRPFTWPP
jgi:hypothetical protein